MFLFSKEFVFFVFNPKEFLFVLLLFLKVFVFFSKKNDYFFPKNLYLLVLCIRDVVSASVVYSLGGWRCRVGGALID